ncbi:MAG: helix-turn-helix transcriptional regulator [Alphaproteobacteria bacterium]|nr:helix-turn-helix transcriptional regulator [Alphaproteobacteria bacterium]
MEPTVEQFLQLNAETQALAESREHLRLVEADLNEFVSDPTSHDLLELRERARRGAVEFSDLSARLRDRPLEVWQSMSGEWVERPYLLVEADSRICEVGCGWWRVQVQLAAHDDVESGYRALGSVLKWIRHWSGETQASLAERLGTTRGVINHIENARRRPALDRVAEWARVCGYQVDLGIRRNTKT